MHAARAINQKRQHGRCQPEVTSRGRLSPMNGRASEGRSRDRSVSPVGSDYSGQRTRTISRRNSAVASSSWSSTWKNKTKLFDQKNEAMWGKLFCGLGILVTFLGLVLLAVGLGGSELRAAPFVFGVFATASGLLVLMFGVCFMKASEHWPHLMNHGRVGNIFIISSSDIGKHKGMGNNDIVRVLTVPSSPPVQLEFVNEQKQEKDKLHQPEWNFPIPNGNPSKANAGVDTRNFLNQNLP